MENQYDYKSLLDDGIRIVTSKENALKRLDELSIDYSILDQEIEDIKSVIRDILHYIDHQEFDETELRRRLHGTFKTTTSGSIYSLLGKVFAEEWEATEVIARLRERR